MFLKNYRYNNETNVFKKKKPINTQAFNSIFNSYLTKTSNGRYVKRSRWRNLRDGPAVPSSSWAWVPSFVAALRNPQSTVSKTRKSVMFCWRWEGGCYWGRALRKRYARLCAYVNIPARAAAGRSWAARRTAWACFVLFKRGGGGDVLLCAARCVAESSNIKQVVRIVIGANIQAENRSRCECDNRAALSHRIAELRLALAPRHRHDNLTPGRHW